MKIIDTSITKPADCSPFEREQIYNGMDCCLTLEIHNEISPQLDAHTQRTYDFSRSLQAPALEMALRGIRVDAFRREQVIDEYFERIENLKNNLDKIVLDGVGLATFNSGSPQDVAHLLYDVLQIPPPRGKRTTNRDALEKMEVYLVARQIIRHITAIRDLGKKIQVLKTEIDPDGRLRTTYNIAGTNTGRFSSSFSVFGTGGNQQNVEESLRSIFISDPGMKFCKLDGAQIQSRIQGATEWNYFKDGTYLDVCESSDLHTTVAMMTWPELDWTDDMKANRKIAETPFYRHYDRRFMCKKLGHGSNFDGQPETLATQSRIPLLAVIEFARNYHSAFPAHRMLRDAYDDELRKTGTIISIDGRKRQFWGRRGNPELVREALAYNGQAGESWIVNTGMLNIWWANIVQLMKQDHDAVVVQYPEEAEDELIPQILKLLEVPLPLKHNRTLLIPFDAQVGWNLGKYDKDKNPMGLKEYAGTDTRKREKELSILQRKPKR